MTDQADLEKKLWKALKSDRTLMLGLVGVQEGHANPMTAQLHPDYEKGELYRGPLWFFTAKDTDLARATGTGHRAIAHFADKNHDLFASLHGRLTPDNSPDMIDRLWNPFVAAWFEGGKEDPKLELLRFETDSAQIWLNDSSLLAGVKLLLGADPKKEYADKVAKVQLNETRPASAG